MRRLAATLPAVLLGVLLSGCGQALALSHSETGCVNPGGKVTLTITTSPGSTLSFKVVDDFQGDLGAIGPLTVGGDGKATTTWQAPARLSTTTLHFLLTASKGDARASRDIHVIVGGNGRTC